MKSPPKTKDTDNTDVYHKIVVCISGRSALTYTNQNPVLRKSHPIHLGPTEENMFSPHTYCYCLPAKVKFEQLLNTIGRCVFYHSRCNPPCIGLLVHIFCPNSCTVGASFAHITIHNTVEQILPTTLGFEWCDSKPVHDVFNVNEIFQKVSLHIFI